MRELLAIPEVERRHEIVAGELVPKAQPSGRHGRAQAKVVGHVDGYHRARPGPRGPGGWHFATEVEVELETHEVYRPDVSGWRRENLPELPAEIPIRTRPDWVCEVLSPSNATNDTVKKLRGYHRAGVPHYWIVDPSEETLTVLRWAPEGYLLTQRAERGDVGHAEPFDAHALAIGALFGDD